jgi:hypothetical protein
MRRASVRSPVSAETFSARHQAYGWDRNGTSADAQIDFDPDSLELKWSSSKPFPQAVL